MSPIERAARALVTTTAAEYGDELSDEDIARHTKSRSNMSLARAAILAFLEGVDMREIMLPAVIHAEEGRAVIKRLKQIAEEQP